jgi:hypothetical protein
MYYKVEEFDFLQSEVGMTFDEALEFAEKAGMERPEGFSDWILPTVGQLKLLQMSDTCVPEDTFWSSSICEGEIEDAWVVDFTDGAVYSFYRTFKNLTAPSVRLIRASQLTQIGLRAVDIACSTY